VADPLRVMIVDDEAPARALLRQYLGVEPGVVVVGECVNGFEAVKAISEQRPDLIFLDIQMPRLDGFEVLELLDPVPGVIFCTAYDEHALRAFEVHAVDYLLKPFGRERLAEALAHARERLTSVADATGMRSESRPAAVTPGTLAAAARPAGHTLERIAVRDGAQVHVIPVERVDLLEAQDDYVAIHEGGRTHLKHQTLAALAETLDPARFVRVHRSFVVNVERIARLELLAKDSRVAVLRDGKQVPISRSGHERLKAALG
jgi:two-component system LytT family response regulator